MRDPKVRQRIIDGMVEECQSLSGSSPREASVKARSLAGSIERDNQRSLDELFEDLDLHLRKRGPDYFGRGIMRKSVGDSAESYGISIKRTHMTRANPVRSNPRRNPAMLTIDQINDKFLSELIAYDKRQEKSEFKRYGRINIHRLPLLLKALGNVRADMKGVERSSSASAMRDLILSIQRNFSEIAPMKKIVNIAAVQLSEQLDRTEAQRSYMR